MLLFIRTFREYAREFFAHRGGSSSSSRSAKPHPAICNSSCAWWRSTKEEDKDIYICKATGNSHMCGLARCNRMLSTVSSRTCTITGCSYAGEFVFYTPTRAGGGTQMAGKGEDGDDEGNAQANAEFNAESSLGVLPTSAVLPITTKPRKRGRAPITASTLAPVDTMVRDAQAVVQSLLQDAAHLPEATRAFHGIARLCMLLWKEISILPQFTSHRRTYTYEHHCCVVMWYMANGGLVRANKLSVIPPNLLVRTHLPLDRSVIGERAPALKGGTLTAAKKSFCACIHHVHADAIVRINECIK